MEKIDREKLIALALFKCTVEQSTHLIDKFNDKTKTDFNIWLRHGFNILEGVEKSNFEYYQILEQLSDIIHTAISLAKEEADSNSNGL